MKKKLVSVISSMLISFLSFQSLNAINFYNQNLNSDSVYMVNCDLEQSVAEKNIDKKRSPASLTKIVTFLVTYDNCKNKDETKFSVNKEILDMMDPDSSGSKLKDGEEFSVTDLLHTMMISSSGYAAMTLAYNIGQGDVGKFVDMMNKKVVEIGCENTHFENPDGIYNENQYSTALDMYKIARYAMKNKDFLDIVGKSEYNMFGDERDPVITTNHLIDRKRGGKYYYPWAKGIKTGYIDDAGRCLISYATKDGKTYLLVVMGGPSKDENGKKLEDNTAMLDSINLYNWAFENLKIVKICEKYSPLSEVPLNFAWGRDKLILSSSENRYVAIPKESDSKEITLNYNIPKSVNAPIKKGDSIGSADVIYKNEKINSIDLVSTEDIKRNYIVLIFDIIKSIVSSKIFIFMLILLILIGGFYTLCFIRKNKNRKKKNKIIKISDYKKDK